MTAAEIRATVLAYYRVRNLLSQSLTREDRAVFEDFLERAEEACRAASQASAPTRWARAHVGPVLAAGIGATRMGEETTPVSALRMFGLAGEHALTAQAAWKMIQPYVWEPAVSAEVVAEVRRKTGFRMAKLSATPAPVDVLEELTRPRGCPFAVQVSHWLAEYFREHASDDDLYAGAYRSTWASLTSRNEQREMAQLTGSIHGHMERQDWLDLMHGKLPRFHVETRAAYIVVRRFITDYWAQWAERDELRERATA